MVEDLSTLGSSGFFLTNQKFSDPFDEFFKFDYNLFEVLQIQSKFVRNSNFSQQRPRP